VPFAAVAASSAEPQLPVEDDAPVLEVREVSFRETPQKGAVQSDAARRHDHQNAERTQESADVVRAGTRRVGRAGGHGGELLAALRAAAHGADAAEVLGSNLRWEKMMAAVLSLLIRKHLILDRELMEELRKI